MGKNRVTVIGDETIEAEEKQKKALKKAEKKAREAAENKTDDQVEEEVSAQEQTQSESEEAQTAPEAEAPKEEVKAEKPKAKKEKFQKARSRSANYKEKVVMVDKNKSYSLSEALELLQKIRMAKFDEAVELHINTMTDGISGQVKLPHGTGKDLKVAIADDAILAEVEKGKVNFDILIATPDMMPKLAKVARVLGPRGLMPNPKNGTISPKPEEAAKAFQGGLMHFKTESKLPVMHLVVGKVSFGEKQLEENINTAISAVKRDRIRKVVLKSTMSPGIRLAI